MCSPAARLIEAIDLVIVKHGPTNPDLLRELLKIRAEIQYLSSKRDVAGVAAAALRVATWLKFIFDMMDDGP